MIRLFKNKKTTITAPSLDDTTHIESQIVGHPLPYRNYVKTNCQYGAVHVAASYAGINNPEHLTIRGEWAHGWHPPEHNVHPELIVGSLGDSFHQRETIHIWVARQDQVDCLKSYGYKNVEAIGLPIVYLPQTHVEREQGSLLVLPIHSNSSTKIEFNFDSYVEEILSISNKFSRVVACVHADCIRNGYWVKNFQRAGIPVISGADWHDENSLERVRVLFSRFEFITTNGFGSHLPYGAIFGAKVSIFGQVPKYKFSDFEGSPEAKNCPQYVSLAIELSSEEHLRSHYNHFFCHPLKSVQHIDWGRIQVGSPFKRPPSELRKILLNRPERAFINIKRKLFGHQR